MKNITLFLLMNLLAFSLTAQDEYVEIYTKVMNDFLSNACLSFDMSAIQYGDLEGKEKLEQVDLSVIKKDEIWYIASSEQEIIYSKDFLVTIDNQSQQIKMEKMMGFSPDQIFGDALGMENIMEYLQLAGSKKVLGNGNTMLDFSAPGANQTSIELEYNPANSIVFRSTANIDMTYYDEIDHPMDGMRIESIYRNSNIKECNFDQKTAAIVNSNFSILENADAFQNYKIQR